MDTIKLQGTDPNNKEKEKTKKGPNQAKGPISPPPYIDPNKKKKQEQPNNNQSKPNNNDKKDPNNKGIGGPSVPPQNPNKTKVTPKDKEKKPAPPRKKPNFWLMTLLFLLIFFIIWGIFFVPRVYSGTYDQLATGLNNYTITAYSAEWYYGYYIQFYYDFEGTTYVVSFDNMTHLTEWWSVEVTAPNVDQPYVGYYTGPGWFAQLLRVWLPWIVIMVIAWVLIKRITEKQSGVGKISKKSLTPQISNVKFRNVAGYEDIKAELIELVDFLKQPNKYANVGARTPKGIMLSGPPGTGKTLFAKAVAGEAGIPFYSISGSDFVEMFVGVGASRVRALFETAKQSAPSLIFIDELDAVGRMRGAGVGGGNDEREQTLNQLLVEMDGFSANSGIMIMAATNRPDVLDPALKRPGRFDRSVQLRLPDFNERKSILEVYAKVGNKVFDPKIDWANISQRTPGFSGAELENVMNEAAILSVRIGSSTITLDIIDESIDRVIGGPSKVNNAMSLEEKKLIAYHESGHAIIGLVDKNAEKVQKISIVPRGDAGGYVLMTPKKEKIIQTKSELISKITSYMGGRVSEEVFFGKSAITTGAYSDIQEATKIARRMVTEFGMSELGPIQYETPQGSVFLGRDMTASKNSSSQIQYEIDKQVRKLIENAYLTAKKIIESNKDLIELFSKALIIKETLNAEEIEYIYKNKKLTQQILDLEKMQEKSKKSKTKKDNNTKNTKTIEVK